MSRWTSPIYAFYKPIPDIDYVSGRKCHTFQCAAKSCTHKICRYLDKGDAQSTSNLRKHVIHCWGSDIVETASEAKNASVVRDSILPGYKKNGLITAAFERKGHGKVLYSHRTHTQTETRYWLHTL